jgi:hypothetical protein
MCDASVPIAEMTLEFDEPAPQAGDEVGMDIGLYVTVPIPPDQTISIGLPGFNAPSSAEFEFDTTDFQTDAAFLLNDLPPMPFWKKLGCIRDRASQR